MGRRAEVAGVNCPRFQSRAWSSALSRQREKLARERPRASRPHKANRQPKPRVRAGCPRSPRRSFAALSSSCPQLRRQARSSTWIRKRQRPARKGPRASRPDETNRQPKQPVRAGCPRSSGRLFAALSNSGPQWRRQARSSTWIRNRETPARASPPPAKRRTLRRCRCANAPESAPLRRSPGKTCRRARGPHRC